MSSYPSGGHRIASFTGAPLDANNYQSINQSMCGTTLPSNFSCTSYFHTYYMCSMGELMKGEFGMAGTIAVSLIALALAEQTILIMLKKRPPMASMKLVKTAFLM